MKSPSFRDELYFLSNMYPCEFNVLNITYNSSEQYYQSRKCIHDKELFDRVILAKDGYECKRLLKGFKPNKYWNPFEVMRNTIFYKFSKNTHLLKKLQNTPDELLIENNPWHDNFWGNCTCKKCINIPGKNILGKLLKECKYTWNIL